MKNSLVLKLLPVALMAAIGLFLAARATPQADASVSGISPASFVSNAGSPVSFSFVAQAGAGTIGIAAGSTVSTFVNATCTGCAVSGNGTSSVLITPPVGTSNFTVGFTLDVACTASGLPVSVTATQGNSSTASGVTGTCACNSALLGTCGCTVLTTACGCAAYSTLAVAGCGCQLYGSAGCACGTYAYANCGCLGTSTVYGAIAPNCGAPVCPGTVGVYANGAYNPYANGVYNPYASLYGNAYAGNLYSNVYGSNVYGGNCGSLCTTNGLLANCAVGTSQVSVTVPGTAVCGSRFNVLVTVRNSIGGIALDGTAVSLSSNMGAVTPAQTVTSGGIASASLLLPPAGAGAATVTASANGATGSAAVSVTCTAAAPPVQVITAPVPPLVIQQPIISAPNAGDGGCLATGGCN